MHVYRQSTAFFRFIDVAAEYFILFEATDPVRSVNATEVEITCLKPYCAVLIIFYLCP